MKDFYTHRIGAQANLEVCGFIQKRAHHYDSTSFIHSIGISEKDISLSGAGSLPRTVMVTNIVSPQINILSHMQFRFSIQDFPMHGKLFLRRMHIR